MIKISVQKKRVMNGSKTMKKKQDFRLEKWEARYSTVAAMALVPG